MRKILLSVLTLVVALWLCVACFSAGSAAATAVSLQRSSEAPFEEFDLFWEAWGIVKREYIGEIPPGDIVARGAARGLVRSLDDPASGLIAPEFARLERENASGFYRGIGASVRVHEDGHVAVAIVFAGSPAEEAGLRPGDVLLAVDGRDTASISLYEAVALIRGPAGTSVSLTVFRPSSGDSWEVEIERREIEIPTATLEILPEGIAHIRLNEFNARAHAQLCEAIERALADDAWAVILDLRDNPGGFLDQSISVADEFLNYGTVLIERGREVEERVHLSKDGGAYTDGPLVVLVNGGSASASEIVAGAIQARSRGTLVGERTFGKGSVQYAFELSDGSELRVTTALWYTPDDKLIQGSGIEPDVVVGMNANGDEDTQLQRAVEFLVGTRQ